MAPSPREADRDTDPKDRGPRGLIDPFDALLALGLILSAFFFIYEASKFPEPAAFLGENVLPEQFPQLLLFFIAAMALLLPFEHLFEIDRWPLIRKSRSEPIGRNTVVTVLFVVALLALAPTIGTILMILAISIALPVLWGERRWLLLLVYAPLFTAAVTYVFSDVLSVFFEPGIFGITLR